MLSIRFLTLLVFGLMVPVHALGQSLGNSMISGKVVDARTGEPLAGVHVFLSSRLQGTTTDAEGEYQISPLTLGSYKVVASIIGYQAASQEIQVEHSQKVRLNIPLEPIIYELDGVEVTDSKPKEWEKQLKEFNQRFLGRTGNAKESLILNPYVLSFEDNGTVFQAFASEPLTIENRSLGYTLTFVLDHFHYNSFEDKSYTNGTWRFEELEPTDEKERQEWLDRREVAYKGSLQHLLWALVHDKAEPEGFSVLRDYSEGEHAPELFIHRYHPVLVEDILKQTEKAHEYEMAFDDFIRVYFLREKAKGKLFKKMTIPAEQLSYLKTSGGKIIVHKSGYMYGSKEEAGNLLVFGHLASLGVADLLPQEYAVLRGEQ